VIESQLFVEPKDSSPSDLVSSVLKYYPRLSNVTLQGELARVYNNDILTNVKSVCALWNLVKENNLENTVSEVHKLEETALTAPVSTAEFLFEYSKKSKGV
jgi:hypothetical protein